jgi:hypothetical protein
VLVSSKNLKHVKNSAWTASTKALRSDFTRSVPRSAAWKLFFSPPIQRLHGPPQRGLAHRRPADRGQPDAQLV